MTFETKVCEVNQVFAKLELVQHEGGVRPSLLFISMEESPQQIWFEGWEAMAALRDLLADVLVDRPEAIGPPDQEIGEIS